MAPELIPAFLTLFGVLIGGFVSYSIQRQQNRHEILLLKEQHKTDFMAETTARHYLMSKKFTDRSFSMLEERLGGFESDELRKILVRAGAVRHVRKDGSEWWRLIEREAEAIRRQREKRESGQSGSSKK
ncbi:hypothetical protein ACFL5T_03565 [Gemmatimonadota bacterium]